MARKIEIDRVSKGEGVLRELRLTIVCNIIMVDRIM